jgi:chemotaxis family two-component system response regulator Rcp1
MNSVNQPGQYDILLVDDSAADAKIFQEALLEASARARLYWVSSGQEALDFVNQKGRFVGVGPVKLMVLDLNMPGLDGIEILRRIKINPEVSRLPVILLSSSRAPEEVDLAYSLGANVFFSKPLSLENYIQKVRILVQHWLDFAELPTPISIRSDGRSPASFVRSSEDEIG